MYTTVQKFGISKKILLLFSKIALSGSKGTIKTLIMVQNILIKKKYLILKSELDVIKKSWKKSQFLQK